MKKNTDFGVVEELEAMRQLVTAISIYRLHEEVILREVLNYSYQHHLCMAKDMRNTSSHEEMTSQPPVQGKSCIRVSDSLEIPLFSQIKLFSVFTDNVQN